MLFRICRGGIIVIKYMSLRGAARASESGATKQPRRMDIECDEVASSFLLAMT